ncbi:hypothetical protein DACRYDRAFT_103385 [Dacryopinax primogenitus]|uniref:Uncharacterized protein n=1 Tax=Dacryopinax primogenitus (strain DJM 731) TaxID=1858805 RepID=M5GH13_DACPD|nr:uncharacterized protein DACRYDRAFT_103385 [Dacryopinax primogenitus]EJU06438.1 hypothetical protein DACRYDRAFT_103385 [Dacryopinax primogenitus]
MVVLLLNSPQSTLICDLPEKWVQLFDLDQQEELAALSALPKEDEEEDKDEKEFKMMLSGVLMSMVSLASPLVKAEKAKAKAKGTMLAKLVMLHLNNCTNKMLPVTRACRRLMKADSCNAGWMIEEMLAMLLLATTDDAVLESFAAENCCLLCCKHAVLKDGWLHHECNIAEVPDKAVCSACKAAKKPCSAHIATALPPVPAEELFCLETPEPIEETAKKPIKKKKQKPVCTYALAKPKKHEQEDDKDLSGPLAKQSRLLEAEIELLIVPLWMVEHKMLELCKSLQMAQKVVDMVQKVVDTVLGWADQVQTLLGRALAE